MSASRLVVCPHCNSTNRVPAQRLAESPNCGRCHQPLLDGRPVELTAANFPAQTGNGDLPVVVDFWAPWCGPCKMMAPAFEQTASQLRHKARFAKVDTEAQPQLAAPYGIRSIPTLVLFKNGREVDRVSGAMGQAQLTAWLSRHL